MSNFTLGPLPCQNPESFSKFVSKSEIGKKKSCTVEVHRNVEGENNGECYKIRGPKTPFLLNNLEKSFRKKKQSDNEKKAGSRRVSSAGTKRERKNSEDSEDELEDANQPSTSTQSPRKKQRNQRN
uniref:DET1- and DDB1-associated protein 1 n=1 Tax=Caenorhabditis tropicalis TaxID=1561998 RepID=A0A1I7UY52_9PELO